MAAAPDALDVFRCATTPEALTTWLLHAASHGMTDVLRALLADGRANPCANNDCAVRAAGYTGHIGVMRVLLADGRANPAAVSSESLVAAAEAGHTQVVYALLADGRADPTVGGSCALGYAARGDHAEVVAALLADGRVDPAAAGRPPHPSASPFRYGQPVARCLALHARWVRRRPWVRGGM
jgi:hypothetical protein